MKIAILAERMLPGSIPKVTGSEVRYLTEMGHDVEVVTLMDSGLPEDSYQFQEFLQGVRIRELSREMPWVKRAAFKLPFFSFLSAYHLLGPFYASQIIKKGEYDAIVALNTLTSLSASLIWRRRKIPYVCYDWDPFCYILDKVYKERWPGIVFKPMRQLAAWFDRLVVDDSVVALSLSDEHAALLRSLTRQRTIELLYMGCKPVAKIPESRGDYLLAIDRWDRGNMPHLLLDVMARLKTRSKLVIAGFCSEDWVRESFLKERDEKGLKDIVSWLGPVNEDKLDELYLGARAWLHPIEETSVSMPALEAAAHGCPIVMPRGTPLFQPDIEGFFPEEGNVGQYAACVDRLIADERLAWQMGEAAWNLSRQYSWEAHARLLDDIIKKYVCPVLETKP